MKKDALIINDTPKPGELRQFSNASLSLLGELPALITAPTNNMDYAIDEVLSKVGALLAASRVYVMLNEKDGKYLRNTHEWVNQKIGPVMFSWPLYDYEYDLPSLKQIISEQDFYFAHTHSMPQDLSRVLGKQGVRSIMVAPIERDGSQLGLVGADFCERECEPHSEFPHLFRALSGLISLALERKHYQTMRAKLSAIRTCVDDIEPLLAGHGNDENEQATRPAKPTTLLDAERRIIIETLELYNGNKLKTAKHLGLTWPSLDRRCKKLGIEARRR